MKKNTSRLFLCILLLVILSLSMLYISFTQTDKILNIFKDQIHSVINERLPNSTSFAYKNIEGSLSSSIKVNNILISNEFESIQINKLVFHPYQLSNFYLFIYTLLNADYYSHNLFKFQSIEFESIEISNSTIEDSLSIYFKQITINKDELTSNNIIINYLGNKIDLFELRLNLNFYDYIDFNILNIKTIQNKRIHISSKKIELFNKKINNQLVVSNCTFIFDLTYDANDKLFNITSYNNYLYMDNIKYYFNYNIDLQSKINNRFPNVLIINKFVVFNDKQIKYIDALGRVNLDNMYINLNINTNKLEYFDFIYPQKGKINITGQDYLYEINFLLNNIENMVELTFDKLKGKFTFNLQDNNKPLLSFSLPVVMKDKYYDGLIRISDIFSFDSIYDTKIEIITERINPFKLKELNQID